MEANVYSPNPFGRVAWDRLGNWDYPYFLPNDIPKSLDLSDETQLEVLIAERELGMLSGSATTSQDFDLLTGTFALLEALSSSRIEGTQSTLNEVLSNEIPRVELESVDLREIFNYQAALETGMYLLRDLPITQRLFLAVQKELLAGVRGQEKSPGTLRNSPVWVGQGQGPADASYIPPLQHHIPDLLSDWEHYVNDAPKQVVSYLALSHYQFETIHPLLDGNGRVGRILIELQLVAQGLLPRPALGISNYFEKHKTEYYQRLQAVRERGEIDQWIRFFAIGVSQKARAARALLSDYRTLRAEFAQVLGNREFADALIKNPLPTVTKIMSELGVSQPTAAKLLAKAQELGLAESLGKSGRGNKQRWVVTKLWTSLQAHQSADE